MTDSILITYATRFGSTEEAAAAIAQTLRESGCTVECRPMVDVQTLDGYAAVVLGSAVNYANWLPPAIDFAREHQKALAGVPLAIFTVHIQNIADDAESKQKRLAYLDEVRSYVQPVSAAFFAGRFNRHAAAELLPRWLAWLVPTLDFRKWKKIRAWANTLPALLFEQVQLHESVTKKCPPQH